MCFQITATVSTMGMAKYLLAEMLCALIASQGACGGGDNDAPASSAAEESAQTENAATQEPEVKVQLGCINRTGNPCTLIYSTEEEQGTDGFIERAKDRTNGRVEFEVSSYPSSVWPGPTPCA